MIGVSNLSKEQAAEILIDINAVNISFTQPFKYSSGIFSPIYTNCRIIASHSEERDLIINTMINNIELLNEEIDVVASAGISSIFLASLIAQRLEIPMIYVRTGKKSHGKGKEIEGILNTGDKVLLVSDIISTEADIPHSINAILNKGGEIIHCISIFNNNIGNIEDFLQRNKIAYSFLTDLSTLLTIAVHRGKLSEEDKLKITRWSMNIDEWETERRNTNNILLSEIGKQTAQILLEVGAVTINSKKPYKYTSGMVSPIYTDNRLLFSNPKQLNIIIDAFINIIENIVGLDNIDGVAGTATSGIPLATLIADRLDFPMVYVNFSQDSINNEGYVEGTIHKDDRLIIIEDHITTGKSVLSTIRILREAGIIPNWCLAIFTYDTFKSKNTFLKEKIDLITLSDLTTLMDVAIDNKYITKEEQETVLDWLEYPEFWKSKKDITIEKEFGTSGS